MSGRRPASGSSLATVALVVLTLAFAGGVGVVGAAGTAGATAGADAASVTALQDDSTLDAEIESVDDTSADSLTVDPSRESVSFTGFGSSDDSTDGLTHLEFTWTVDDTASGSITTSDRYDTAFFATYDLGPEDAGETFDVELTITDEDGATATDSFTVQVREDDNSSENLPPTASLVWADDPSVEQPAVEPDAGTVRFSAADSTDPDHDVSELDYEWEVADAASGNVSYEDDGQVLAYDVASEDEGRTLSFAVTVTDPEGESDSMALSLDVASVPEPTSPVADVESIDHPGADQITVEHDRESIDFDGFSSSHPDQELSELDAEWSVEGNASGQFVNSGQYSDEWFTNYELGPDDAGSTFDVVLTVTADGASDTDSVTVTVTDDGDENQTDQNEAPDADLVWADDPSVGTPTVTVDDGSVELSAAGTTDADHEADQLTYEWSGEGAANELQASADGQTATYDLASTDGGATLTFAVTATDPAGDSDTATIDVVVDPVEGGEAPTANVTYLLDPGVEDPFVETKVDAFPLSAESSVDPNYDLDELTIDWSVESAAAGELDDSDRTVLRYEVANADRGRTLEFTLEVTNDDGYSDTDTIEVTFEAEDAEPPKAALEFLDHPGADQIEVAPETNAVNLSAFSSSDPQYDLKSLQFEWSVDGTASGDLVTSDAYEDQEDHFVNYELAAADAGTTFDVHVTVINPAGERDTASVTISVAARTDVQPPTADLSWADNASVTAPSVDGSVDLFNLTAAGSTDPIYDQDALDVHWSADASASGDMNATGPWAVTYEIDEADRNSTIDFEVTVTNPDGESDVASLSVDVEAVQNESDDQDGQDDEQSDDDDDSTGGGPIAPPSGGSTDDGSDGDTGENEPDTAPEAFSFTLDSSVGSVVLTGENAQTGSTARIDLAVVLGAFQLDSFEGEAAADSESFEVEFSTSDRSGPAVDGDVVEVLEFEDDEMLASSTLDFAVSDGDSDAGDGETTIYEYRDGEWAATDLDASAGSTTADFSEAEALAVVSESTDAQDDAGADETESDDESGFGTIAIALVIGVLVVVAGVEYYRRQ